MHKKITLLTLILLTGAMTRAAEGRAIIPLTSEQNQQIIDIVEKEKGLLHPTEINSLNHFKETSLIPCYLLNALIENASEGKKDQEDLVCALIHAGEPINTKSPKDGIWTPLHNAACKNYFKVVTLLLQKGAKTGAEKRDEQVAIELSDITLNL